MQRWIDEVRVGITTLVNDLKHKLKAKFRLGFIGYRDHGPNEINPEVYEQKIDNTTSYFTENINIFTAFLQNIKADGGNGDMCEVSILYN